MKASSLLRWTVHMDKVFLNALIAKEINGNRVDGHFTSKAYENIVKECTEKLGHPFTKENLNNRLKMIKSNFSEVYDLFNASGWVGMKKRKCFTLLKKYRKQNNYMHTERLDQIELLNGISALLWSCYALIRDTDWFDLSYICLRFSLLIFLQCFLLQKKPEAAKWKKTSFHHYDFLLKLFSKDRATGELATTAKEKKLKAMGESSVDNQEESVGELPRPSESSDSSNVSKGKKRKAGEMFMDELSSIKEGLDNVAQALREGNLIMERGRAQVYSPQEVFDELTRMEFDSINRRKAYRFLSAKQSRIRELFGCPSEERKAYLMEMMFEEDI
ncbi:L10-interacting MYB domain-containing protein [Bienertia sinuspersici]